MVERTQKYSNIEIPNWSYWKQFRGVTLEEAVLLSLGINPDLMPDQLEMLQSSHSTEITERIEVAYSWANDVDWSDWAVIGEPSKDKVDLRGFINWCDKDRQWKPLPPEFLEIGRVSSEEHRVDEFSQKPKNRRQENNDLRLIGALRKLLADNDVYSTNTQLINDLCLLYKGQEPFKTSTLEGRFSDAKRILESD